MDASHGAFLAAARKAKGYSLDLFAKRIRVDPARWQAFESGTPSVSTAAVARAAFALGLDPDRIDQLSVDPALAFSQVGVPDFFHADVAELQARLERARAYRFVLDLLKRRGALEDHSPQPTTIPAYKQGYSLARTVRATLGEPSAPLPDLKLVLERDAGVLVSTHRFTAKSVRAVTAKEPRTRTSAVVVAEASSPRERLLRRVDLAHELAHVLFDDAQESTDLWIDTEESSSAAANLSEQRARAFAAELLLPLVAIEDELGPKSAALSAAALASTAKVLMEAYRATPDIIANHLTNHGYLHEGERELLRGMLSEAPVPSCVEDFTADALDQAVRSAVEQHLMTTGRALELLGRSVHELAAFEHVSPA